MPVLLSHSRLTQCGEHQHQPLWQRVCPWQRFLALPTGEKSPLSGDIISRPKTLIMRQRFSRLELIDLSDMARTCYGSICCACPPPIFRTCLWVPYVVPLCLQDSGILQIAVRLMSCMHSISFELYQWNMQRVS